MRPFDDILRRDAEHTAGRLLRHIEPAWIYDATGVPNVILVVLASVVTVLYLVLAVVRFSLGDLGQAGAACILAWTLASLRWYQR